MKKQWRWAQSKIDPWVKKFRTLPVIDSITRTGWAILLGGVLTGLIGWRWGWLEFRALAIMAAIVLIVAFQSFLRRREHTVDLHLHRPRVQAGEEALGRVAVTTEKGAAATTMEFAVGKANASFRVGAISPGDEHEEIFAIPTSRRGIIPVGPVRSVQTDPIGAISKETVHTEALELYIHPRITPVSSRAIGMLKDVEGVTTSNLSSLDVSFHALREYVPGDDRRAVHWKTTARLGKLMVRQFEETMRAHLVLLLSTQREDYATEDDFELAVSAVGSIGASALRDERQLSVFTSAEELQFPNAVGFLDRLSGVQLTDEGHDLNTLALQVGGVSGASVVGIVTGNSDLADLRSAELRMPVGLYTFGIRCDEETEVSRRKVGDLTVLDVSDLATLRSAVGSLG